MSHSDSSTSETTSADWVAKYSEELTAYQDEAYAARYRTLVERVESAESGLPAATGALATAVAKAAYKLMAYKDEY